MHLAAIHEGNKPFKCSACFKAFVDKAQLNVHVASVHEKNRPFKCSICDDDFVVNEELGVNEDPGNDELEPGTFVFENSEEELE